MTRGVAKRDHAFPKDAEPTVFMMSNPLVNPPREQVEKGGTAVSARDHRWLRCDIKSISLIGNCLLRQLSAEEARELGLVARVVAQEAWLEEAKGVAAEIAAKSPVSVRLAKEAIDYAFEAPLSAGVDFERRSFYLARASEDADEGLSAFVEKRKPKFKGR